MPKLAVLVVMAVLALAPPAAYAHGSAAHGGTVAEVGSHHLELVVGEGELAVHVTDAKGAPVETGDEQPHPHRTYRKERTMGMDRLKVGKPGQTGQTGHLSLLSRPGHGTRSIDRCPVCPGLGT